MVVRSMMSSASWCFLWLAGFLAAGAEAGQWRCERAGQEILDGRQVVRYRIRSAADREMLGWVDPGLKFPLKIQSSDGKTTAVANILEGLQPARLFEIPADFRKFDPEALIKRIKQSDVWVEEPSP